MPENDDEPRLCTNMQQPRPCPCCRVSRLYEWVQFGGVVVCIECVDAAHEALKRFDWEGQNGG